MKKRILVQCVLLLSVMLSLNAEEAGLYKRNEISVSYGLFAATGWSNWIGSLSLTAPLGIVNDNPEEDGININYNYRLTKTWGIGFGLSYCSGRSNWTKNDEVIGMEKSYNITLMPRIKGEWLHTKYVTLYSLLGGGVTYRKDEAKDLNVSTEGSMFMFQISPLGIEVGKAMAGFAEVGIGEQGMAIIGMRYRF